jgi:hypothetical protein
MDYVISSDRESFSTNPYGYSDVFVTVGDGVSPVAKVFSRPPSPVRLTTNARRSWITGIEASFLLADLGDSKYSLSAPIVVNLRQDDNDEYIVSFPDAEISRSGETPRVALDWLRSSIIDLYELYKKRENQLGPLPKRQLRALESCLVAKPNLKSRSNFHSKKAQGGNRSRRSA